MSNKLQELTDKLYNEGLSKGKEEGERILAEAKSQAAALVENAKQEAEHILAEAEKQAQSIKSKSESDVKMAAMQCIQATKRDIENLLVDKACKEQIGKATSNPEFVKELIKSVAAAFSASEGKDLSLILPASLQAELEPWVAGELKNSLSAQISASFSKKVAGGFTIGPADGSWFISFTDETFQELISEYMRPVTRKLLFSE